MMNVLLFPPSHVEIYRRENHEQNVPGWGSSNLFDWQVLGIFSPAPRDAFVFTDYATGLPARFYKVSTP